MVLCLTGEAFDSCFGGIVFLETTFVVDEGGTSIAFKGAPTTGGFALLVSFLEGVVFLGLEEEGDIPFLLLGEEADD